MSSDDRITSKISAKNFRRPDKDSFIYTYFEPEALPVPDATIEKFVAKCRSNKISCIIPVVPDSVGVSGKTIVLAGDLYERLVDVASASGIKIGFNIQPILEQSLFADDCSLSEATVSRIRARVLSCYDYYCQSEEHIQKKLVTDTLVSLTAFDEEHGDSIDLRPYVKDGILDCVLPQGNYILKEYHCSAKDMTSGETLCSINKLDHEAGVISIKALFELMGDRVSRHLGGAISLIHASDICFDAPNRRNWDISFNEKFEETYGFDPSPLYNALFFNIGEKTPHIKNLFMSLRAKMLRDGLIAALTDVSRGLGVELIYSLAEPKLTSCSWITGDSLAMQEGSACALLEKAYMYGINSLEISSSAALCYSNQPVCCELFDKYVKTSIDIIFNDAINSFARGANLLLTHLPEVKQISHRERKKYCIRGRAFRRAFCAFAARSQSLLRGGRQVSDIAVLFPIDSMHSYVNFYQSRESKFEYPPTSVNDDYMTLLNILSTYCAHDPTLIHPSLLQSSCTVKDNLIRLDGNDGSFSEFSVIFIPGTTVISLESLKKIQEFYDNGGKVVATVRLPSYAAEYSAEFENENKDDIDVFMLEDYGTENDREVRRIISHIFGEQATDKNLVRKYFKNSNDKGGEAYFLCASKTSSDGSIYTDEELVRNVLGSFDIPLDVYMGNYPRIMRTDRFNSIYPEFASLGMNARIPCGGFINYIHKKRDGSDVYFFSNTTDAHYSGTVYLRGCHKPLLYDPIANKKRNARYRHVCHLGEVYTMISLSLSSGSCVFVLSSGEKNTDPSSLPEVESVECNFLS